MKGTFTLLLWLCGFSVIAQKQKTIQEQIWLGYSNQIQLSEKWGVASDLNLRTKRDYIKGLSQGLIQFGITRYLRNNTARLTASFAYINFFPGDNHPGISRPEFRPWQQVSWQKKWNPFRVLQSVRLEERFRRKIKSASELAHGYHFNYRFRYTVYIQAPLSKNQYKPHTFAAVLGDELFINFGRQIVYNTFDQNRLFGGFIYYANNHDNLQFGFMTIFQQLATPKQYRITYAPRITYLHNLTFHTSERVPIRIAPL